LVRAHSNGSIYRCGMPLCRLDHEPRHGRRVCEVRARDRERRASAGSPCDLISDVDVALGQPVRLASRWRDLQVVEAASKSQGGRLPARSCSGLRCRRIRGFQVADHTRPEAVDAGFVAITGSCRPRHSARTGLWGVPTFTRACMRAVQPVKSIGCPSGAS
jgi:hypothetical protein